MRAECQAELRYSPFYAMTRKCEGIITVERVALNPQGYTTRGRYFGTGLPVYRIDCDLELHDATTTMSRVFYVRGEDIGSVRAAVRKLWPQAMVPVLPLRRKAG